MLLKHEILKKPQKYQKKTHFFLKKASYLGPNLGWFKPAFFWLAFFWPALFLAATLVLTPPNRNIITTRTFFYDKNNKLI